MDAAVARSCSLRPVALMSCTRLSTTSCVAKRCAHSPPWLQMFSTVFTA